MRITPDGKRALVAFTESGDVGVYDVGTRTEIKRIPLGRDAVAASGARVFQGKFGASPAPVGIYITPDGKRAFVSATHADVVVVLDLEGLRVLDGWAAGKSPTAWSGRFEKK